MKYASIIGVAAAVALVMAGLALAAARPAARAATVTTTHTGLGQVVADVRGRSLYLFEKDTRSRSACAGACAAYWPPLLTNGKPVASKGAKPSLVGSIRRADGTRQVTYAGHPLYLYIGDTSRGQTTGEGLDDFGASWYVLTPGGKKIDRD
jgi:predicted lipoprotein with Yx(FWY)xxD motif